MRLQILHYDMICLMRLQSFSKRYDLSYVIANFSIRYDLSYEIANFSRRYDLFFEIAKFLNTI